MGLPGWGSLAITRGDVPLHDVGVWPDLQSVQVIEISWDIVLGVFTVICKTTEQENFISNKCETVPKSRTRGWGISGRLWLELLPLPSRCLQFVQIIAVFPIFHHSSKHQDPGAIHHKPKGSTSWRDVSFDWGHKPLVGS